MNTEHFLLMTRPQQIAANRENMFSSSVTNNLENVMVASYFHHPDQGYMANQPVIEGFNDQNQLKRDFENFKKHTNSELERLKQMIEDNRLDIDENGRNIDILDQILSN